MTAPVVGMTDAFGHPFDSNQIDAIEGTIYPLVFDVTDPDHPGAHFFDSDFYITGPDADLFYIVDYQLIFQYDTDYENPIDSDADNLYAITVAVTDTDGETTNQDIYINIFDDPNDNNDGEGAQPPQFVSDPVAAVPENIDDVVYTAAVDNSGPGNAEDVTFAIVGGADGELFSIDPVTGEVFFNQSPDFENPTDAGGDNVYDITIEAFNQQSGEASQLDVAITVTDENDEAPELAPDAAVTVPENYNDVVYVAEATDADAGSSVTYAITGGADMDKLSINEHTGEVSFNQAPDFDMPVDADGDNTYEIEIVATDDGGNESQIQSVTVAVEDLSDETPVITSTEHTVEFLENAYDAVYTVEATDADASDTVTFRFADDSPDAGYFTIDEYSGAIYVNMPLDHEIPQDADGDNVYELAIIASDDGSNDSEAFTLSVTILNENDNVPVMNGDVAEVVVPENVDGTIYTAAATDDDGDSLQYALGGADAHLFSLDPNTGELSFLAPPDFEHPLDDGGDNIYDVEITASDDDYTSDALAITIEVTDENESGVPPVITSAASASVAENTTGTVYTALADDPDSPSVTFSISGGADAGLFAIDATSGELSFLNSPDYEAPADTDANNVYEVEITASDGVNASDPLGVSITVSNENDNTPVMDANVASVNVLENIAGAIYTAAATDADSDGLQYALGGADALLFSLDPNTGELSFVAPPDFEHPLDQGSDNIYDVEITASDGPNTSTPTVVSITVGNVNEPNLIEGTPGPDTLVGTDGDDMIVGFEGSDSLYGGLGADTLDGGDGTDWADYAEATEGIVANLETGVGSTGEAAGDIYISIENLIGSNFSDVLTGNAGNNILIGLGGVDQLIGGAGDDTFAIYNPSGTVTENSGEGDDTVFAFADYTLSANVETLVLAGAASHGTGNAGDNRLFANEAVASTLDGGAGDDVLNGGHILVNTLIGGLGNDTFAVFNAADTVTENSGEGDDTVFAFADYTLSANVETLVLAGAASHGTGNAGDNRLFANEAVASTLDGGAGDDVLNGGHILVNTLIGGLGNDTFAVFNAADTVTENSGEGDDTVFAFADYTLSANVETLVLAGAASHGTGNAGDNRLFANEAVASTLDGGAGDDVLNGGHILVNTLIGGLGNDTFAVFNAADTVTENSGEGDDIVFAFADYTLSANVETLVLAGAASHGTGNAGDNRLFANESVASTLDGGAGNDTFVGGTGADTFVFSSAGYGADIIFNFTTLDAGGTPDVIKLNGLGLSFESLTITDGGAGAVIATGSGDTITLVGVNAAHLHQGDFLF